MDSQSAKTTGVGGEQRGYDGGKKVRGWKRHLLVDTEGLVLSRPRFTAQRSPTRTDSGYTAEGRPRAPSTPLSSVGGRRGYTRAEVSSGQRAGARGLSVEVVHRTPKPIPEKIARMWAEEWAKEGQEIDWQKLLPRRGFEALPRRWVVERTFSLG